MKEIFKEKKGGGYSLDTPTDFEEYEAKKEAEIESEPKAYFWNDIKNMVFPEIQWRIQGLIPSEGLVMIAAASTSGKTWLAMDMARCIAAGDDFLNEERFNTSQAKVLYIDAENQLRLTRERGELLGFDGVEENLYIYSGAMSLYNSGEVDDEKIKQLEEFILEENIKVVFVDTMRAIAGGLEEQKAEQIRTFLNAFRDIARKEITIVFLEHLRKPSIGEGHTPKKEQVFSSMDKVASSDVLLMLKRGEPKNPNESEISVYQAKNRFNKEIEPFKIIMTDELGENFETVSIKLTYGGIIKKEEKNTALENSKKEILELMADKQPRLTKEILAILNGEIGMGKKNIGWALSELALDKKLTKKKQGRDNLYSLFQGEEVLEIPSSSMNDDSF